MADKPKKGGVLSRSWKRVLGSFRRLKSSADGDTRRAPTAEPPARRAVQMQPQTLAGRRWRCGPSFQQLFWISGLKASYFDLLAMLARLTVP